MTDVLDATQNLYNALQQAAGSRYSYILSRLNLGYTEGTLSMEEIDAINNVLSKSAKPDPYLTDPYPALQTTTNP